ncbi:MAG: hypothetical protein ACK514_16570 [Bacteroidota bacterium]|nr:hypothetical protein [Cytophagales bacterium]MCE2957039.1 hypothetical protein [Flammeovirgaceae bacterium]MCZ8068880.1 hypothetical protein [Cytophagales bacterium]
MNRFRKIYDEPIVYLIDYSDLKVSEMVELLHEAKKMMLEKSLKCCLISVFNDKNFATPLFMREAEKVASNVDHLIQHQAIVGLNSTKKIILKGFNLLLNRDYKSFDSMEEALQHLLQLAPSKDNQQ